MKRAGIIGLVVAASLAVVSLTGCNTITRSMGGTTTIDLPSGTKLVGSPSWDDKDNLWVNTRQMADGDTAQTYDFKEYSNVGILSGNVIVVEHK